MEGRKGNILWLFFLVFILGGLFSVFTWLVNGVEKPLVIEVPEDVGIISGEIFPNNPQQGDTKVFFGEGSDFERMKKEGNFITKYPPIQPNLNSTYDVNSARMTTYMKNNAFKIQLNTPIKNGYLHFRMNTSGNTGGKLFFYLAKDKNTGDSGYIDISSAVYSKYNSDKSYDLLFDIKDIKFLPYGKSDFQSLNLVKNLSYFGRSDYLSTFWVNNKNSYIKEITLAYDEDR